MSLLLGVGVLAWAVPTVAHHSVSAEFDTTKTIKFTGKVKEIDWGNPHIYTIVDATDPDTGKPYIFKVEGGPPNSLFRAGWRKDSLKIGETVTVTGNRAKNPASPNVGPGDDSHRIRPADLQRPERERSGHAVVTVRSKATKKGTANFAVPFSFLRVGP